MNSEYRLVQKVRALDSSLLEQIFKNSMGAAFSDNADNLSLHSRSVDTDG